MDMMDSGNESDDESMSTEILEDIHDGRNSHPIVNKKEARKTLRDRIKQIQTKWKEALLST